MPRSILHIDFNNFYATVECLYHPELRDVPMVVGGDVDMRHGIVLSKNEVAKRKFGVKTGEVLWQVRQRCPDIVVVPPRMEQYIKFSRIAREIYSEYTDKIESFGIDESWLDVSDCAIFGSGESIANELRERVKNELGITASVGVSFNKIFAKLGSDMRKPDATTVLPEDDYRERVWPLDVGDLLYVGRSTRKRLNEIGIETIGDLARFDLEVLQSILGKCGLMLWTYANGRDTSPVSGENEEAIIKSIGNSTTSPRDLENDLDVELIIYLLADSVGRRLRENGFSCRTVTVSVRDCDLVWFERQCKVRRPTHLSGEIAEYALKLFKANYNWCKPIRSIGVRASDLCGSDECIQFDIFGDELRRERVGRLEQASDSIRKRFGANSLRRASMLLDPKLTCCDPKEEHTVHPLAYTRS